MGEEDLAAFKVPTGCLESEGPVRAGCPALVRLPPAAPGGYRSHLHCLTDMVSQERLDLWCTQLVFEVKPCTVFFMWEPPSPSFLKVNFGGSALDGGSREGAGFVIKDPCSRVAAASGYQLSDTSISGAELRATWDESMHSGADVEAFTAALNRDISGGAPSASEPSDSNAGVLLQGHSSTSSQLFGQWQTSSQEKNLVQNIRLEEEYQQFQSIERHLPHASSMQNNFGAEDQLQQNRQLGHNQPVLEQENLHHDQQQQRIKNNPFQFFDKNQPYLDKDRFMQLQAVYDKLANNKISTEDFVRASGNIVGDQLLRQAAHQVMQQQQAQAVNQNQCNPQIQASSQQLLYSGTNQHIRPQTFPLLPPMPSSQNQKEDKSSPLQHHASASTVQLQTDTSFSTPENTGRKSKKIENMSDCKGMHSAPSPSTSMNVVSPEKEISTFSSQAVKKSRQQLQVPQTSFSMYGNSISNLDACTYPRPSIGAAATSLRPQPQNSQMRQAMASQGVVSTQSRSTQPMNAVNMTKCEMQNLSNETKRLHGDSLSYLSNQSAHKKNPNAWQLPTANILNKNPKNSPFPFVKQEVVDQSAEPQNKSQVGASKGSSFESEYADQGSPTSGHMKDETLEKRLSRVGLSASTSTMTQNLISGSVASQSVSIMQMHSQISSATPSVLAGTATKTPPKKITVGQKKPLEVLETSPPQSSKKQKTSGAFLAQSIEQLNDVTAVSGVDLKEEEEQLLSTPEEESQASETARRMVQKEEERLILQKGPLQKKIAKIMSKCGIQSVSSDVEHCLSMCLEERLRGLVVNLIRLSKQRIDIEKTRHQLVGTSDVCRQISMMNRKAKEEWEKRQAEEADKLRKHNEGNTGADGDKHKDEGRSKTHKISKEDDKIRATAANVAARAAVGGDDILSKWQLMAEQARQKREGRLEGASCCHQDKITGNKSLPNSGRSSSERQEVGRRGAPAAFLCGKWGMRKSGRGSATMLPKIARRISAKDVIVVLEREPQMSRSALIYRLYERMPRDSAAA
ncbi:transcription initiation factor TFIID subunit 4b-like [Phoenix dactylifera]|uniref:Transcription initiation factor TFIID subunit 4b-like n=1 Tax=Phoenix dactylifera TaxID=42345 RepID=A0A8B8Z959_PHODC|nr:transcription initiation factor TFIID subunit 4b-like [Phoenix dactylifera]